MSWLGLAVATLATCLLLQRLPILARAGAASAVARRSLGLIANPRVSDHWKERVLPRYAARLAGQSLAAFGLILLAVAPFAALLAVDGAALALLSSWPGILAMTLAAAVAFGLGRALARHAPASDADAAGYSATSRLLHRLALARPAQVEMQLDLEDATAKAPPEGAEAGRHVFVIGLARAGTTALMRAIHASGAFASLTYRDMPFVAAPNLWARLAGGSRRAMARTERAHGDGVLVDFDSPEALEEPFWRAFCGPAYIRPDALVPHAVSDETLARYRGFVGHVLRRYGRPRYLAKNNNALLRLDALAAAFPAALVLVPFRDPLAQAASLRRQHRRFNAATDPFLRAYMGWLVHHEFGPDHRPFVLDGKRPAGTPESLDYWLAVWLAAHRHLLARAGALGPALLPVAYEDLCGGDGRTWRALCRRIGIAPGEAGFRPSRAAAEPGADPALLREARTVYAALRALGQERLPLSAYTPDRAVA